MTNNEIITIIVSIVGVGIAFWQGFSAQRQVEIAKTTNEETKKLLEDIRRTVEKVELISTHTKENIEKQVDKLINNQNQHQNTLLASMTSILANFDPKTKSEEQKQTASDKMTQIFMNSLLSSENPMQNLLQLAEISKQFPTSTNN